MKRSFLLLTVLTAALMLLAGTALASSDVPEHEHWAYCSDPTVCAVCGGAYAGSNLTHSYDWDNWQSDGTNHWHECTVCSAIEDLGAHYASCDSTAVCAKCGAAYSGTNIKHYFDWDHLDADEESHWRYCTNCGAIEGKTPHFVYCTNQDVCAECGTPCSGITPWHNYDYENTLSDSKYHWYTCLDCGEETTKMPHYASCLDRTHCADCGAECSNVSIVHNYDWNKPLFDANCHWWICEDCGEEVNKAEHYANCQNRTICGACGQPYSGNNINHNYNWNKPQYNETSHWFACLECGEKVNESAHWVYCDAPGVCATCGVSCSGCDVYHEYINDNALTDSTYHWWICERCGTVSDKEEHYAWCDQPGVCASCGMAYTGSNIRHYFNEYSVFSFDAQNHWTTCIVCAKVWTMPHDFDSNGICFECGYDKAHEHVWVVTAETAPTCTEDGSRASVCSICGTTKAEVLPNLGGHSWKLTASTPASCTEDGSETYACSVCSETKTEVLPNLGGHSWKLTASTPASCTKDGSETYACSVCSETKTEVLPNLGGHSWKLTASTPASCTEDGSETYACSVCGETKTEVLPNLGGHDWKQDEVRPATCKEGASVLMTCSRCHIWTIEYTSDPLVHELKPVETTDATCTEDGSIVSRCDNCGETATEIIPALGHAYGAYAPSGNDSHTSACSRCGATISKACQMKETKLGTLACSICAVCGRTVMRTPTPAETAAPAEDAEADETAAPAPAPVEVKVIENAVIEAVPAENATEAEAKPVVPKEAVLVVLDCSAITAAPAKTDAAETAAASAEKAAPVLTAFSVSLVVEGEEVELTSAVKMRIPLTEETAPADLTGMKLVLILPSGETVDVEFEIVDGELVFTTDMLGMFAFVPVEA